MEDTAYRKPRSERTARIRDKVRGPAPHDPNRHGHSTLVTALDVGELQQERYSLWPVEVQQFARSKDAGFPLWSVCHRWRPPKRRDIGEQTPPLTATVDMQWFSDWPSCAALYVWSEMSLREMASKSGINERRLFWASSRYGWAEQRATHKLLKEREEEHLTLRDLEDNARLSVLRGTFTDVGIALLRHGMNALNRQSDNIEARDIPALVREGLRLIGAGERLPTEYRTVTSSVEGGVGPAIGQVNILTAQNAEQVIDALAKRALLIQEAKAKREAIPATVIPAG